MKLTFFHQLSLKVRVTVFTLIIFVISIWLIVFYAQKMLQNDMRYLLGEQQLSTVSLLATEIDSELNNRFNALDIVAVRTLRIDIKYDSVVLQNILEQNSVLQQLFNGGAYIMDLNGIPVASFPVSTEKISVNDKDDTIQSWKVGKKIISRPFIDKHLNTPVFVMTVPIRDKQNKIIGGVSGIINLGIPNFLDDLTKSRYSKTGYYLLVAPKYRMVVTASEKSRVMENLPAKGINPFIDDFIDGYEGPAETVTPRGVKMLASAKPVHIANWYVCVLLPIAEAYAPIQAMQYRIFSATFFLMCLISGAMWWMLKHELTPLIITLKNLASWKNTPNDVQFLPTFGREEIDALINGFNNLLEVLQERERYLQAIIENEPECIKIINQEGQLLQMNAAGLRMIDADSLEQAIERNFISLIAPEYRAAFMALHEKVIAGETVQLQFEIIGLKNNRHWMETNAVPMIANGKRVHLAVTRDITERKEVEFELLERKAQLKLLVEKERANSIEKSNFLATLQLLNQELNQKEHYLRELIDNFPFMVWLKDTEGRFLAVNRILAKNFGEDHPNNVFGKTDFDYSPKEMAEGYQKDDLLIMQTKQQKMLEEKVVNYLGKSSWFETFKAPVFGENGKALGTVGFARDISERKRIELQLHENQVQLQLLVEKECQNSIEKSNFLAMLTHELKSPLTTIELATGNIQRGTNPEINALSLKHIQSAASDMSVIIVRCLQADKLEQENSIINLKTFPIDVLIHDRRSQGQWLEPDKKTRLQIDIPAQFLITSDELSCRIIVSNLVENALKYSPEKSVVTISAKVDAEKAGVLIAVCNEIGKAGKPDVDKVFDKYYRGANAQRLRGTGLGLWLVRGIATQLGGTVNYIEHNDKVEFQLWLPQ